MSKLINIYKKIPKKFLDKKVVNINYKLHKINLPCFILIAGKTGTGKTNALMNLLILMGKQFDGIILVVKNKDEPIYRYLIDQGNGLVDVFEQKEGPKFPDINDYNNGKQYFLIMDDLLNEKALLPQIRDVTIRCRKVGISYAFLSQDYFRTDLTLRKNINRLFLFNLNNKTEKLNILRNYPFMDNYQHLFDEINKKKDDEELEEPNSFINININNSTARLNFD